MRSFQAHLVGLDASGVAGAVLSRGLGGRRVRALARAPLPRGALVPSAFDENLVRPDEVGRALATVAEELRIGRAGVCLVLPDGVARLALLELPAGVEAQAFARYRLAPTLPYPADEAILDVLPAGNGRLVAAAVRRSVVQGYEAAAAAAGLIQARLDLAPLAALGALLRDPPAHDAVDVVLGDTALCLAAYAGGSLRVLRSRRRAADPAEGEWLAAEVERTAAAAGASGPVTVRVVGSGGPSWVDELSARGWRAEAGWRLPGDAGAGPMGGTEMAWLGAAV